MTQRTKNDLTNKYYGADAPVQMARCLTHNHIDCWECNKALLDEFFSNPLPTTSGDEELKTMKFLIEEASASFGLKADKTVVEVPSLEFAEWMDKIVDATRKAIAAAKAEERENFKILLEAHLDRDNWTGTQVVKCLLMDIEDGYDK